MPRLNIKTRITGNFSKAADRYDQSAQLQRLIGEQLYAQLLERQAFDDLNEASIWLDLGCGTGYFAEKFQQSHNAQGLAMDIAFGMLLRTRQRMSNASTVLVLNADAESIPLKSDSVTLIFSNFVVQWCLQLQHAIAECWRILKPGAWCALSLPGEGTLKELQSSWSLLDSFDHVNHFYSEEALTQLMRETLPADATVEITRQAYASRYKSLSELLKNLKNIGANTATGKTSPGLMGKSQFARLQKNYEHYRQVDGLLPATYEVFNVLIKKPKMH
jgi:malonyl-CoA O-methyltransferase